MATIREVAERAGVSTATVSRVINNVGTVQQNTRERVLQAIAELGYQPNGVARSLKQDRTQLIGVLLPHIANRFFMDVAKGIEDQVGSKSYSLIMASSDWDVNREQHHLNVFVQQRVQAIAIISVGYTQGDYVKALKVLNVPLILVDRSLPGIDADIVLADNIGGMKQLVDHLIGLGHRNIGLISGPSEIESGHERVEGYRKALSEAGMTYKPELVLMGEDFSHETGYRLTRQLLLDQHPTALVCGNNTLAMGAMLACKELGFKIPRDISLASFGDFDFATLLDPPLTVATNSGYEMGLEVGKLLIKRMKRSGKRYRPKCVRIPSRLIIRSSTAAPSSISVSSGLEKGQEVKFLE